MDLFAPAESFLGNFDSLGFLTFILNLQEYTYYLPYMIWKYVYIEELLFKWDYFLAQTQDIWDQKNETKNIFS